MLVRTIAGMSATPEESATSKVSPLPTWGGLVRRGYRPFIDEKQALRPISGAVSEVRFQSIRLPHALAIPLRGSEEPNRLVLQSQECDTDGPAARARQPASRGSIYPEA